MSMQTLVYLWPFAAMFIAGLLIGAAGRRTTLIYQLFGLLILTAYYALGIMLVEDIRLGGLLEPQTVAFAGQVLIFFIMGTIGVGLTDPVRGFSAERKGFPR